MQTVEIAAGRLATRAQLRDVGVHPLLGPLQKGAMGGQAQDGEGPIQPSTASDGAVVSEQQAPESLREQHAALRGKLRGHDAYYGVTGNAPALTRLRFAVARQWCKWLDRRGGRVPMTWKRFKEILTVYPLPPPRVVHSVYR